MKPIETMWFFMFSSTLTPPLSGTSYAGTKFVTPWLKL